jgi:hypothetical protein
MIECVYVLLLIRFTGSSLKVVGNYKKTYKGEWAIVGGTGEFAFAQGVAAFKIRQQLQGGNIREFRIHCVTLNFPKPVRSIYYSVLYIYCIFLSIP